MKYLLILFGLSSIFASDTARFTDSLDNLQWEEVNQHMPNLGYVPKCLKQFIKDYNANYNYDYALRRFKEEKTIDDTYTCQELTNPNQELGDKIENAWAQSENNQDIFKDALITLQWEEVNQHMPNLGYVPKCLKQFIKDYKANYNYDYALRRFKEEKTIDDTYTCQELTNPNQKLGDKIENAWGDSNLDNSSYK